MGGEVEMNGQAKFGSITAGFHYCNVTGLVTDDGTAPVLKKFVGQHMLNLICWLKEKDGRVAFFPDEQTVLHGDAKWWG